VSLGQLVGGVLGGYLGATFGPKITILLGCLPMGLGWVLIGLAPHMSLLILGRLASGFGGTFLTANCSMLISQYSSPNRRGAFLSFYTLMMSIGILAVYCSGAILYWRVLTTIPATLVILFAASLCHIPESPIWLLGHCGKEAAREALIWLRGSETAAKVDLELEDLLQTQENQNCGLGIGEALLNFRRPDIWRPILLAVSNTVLLMLTGPFVIVFYAVNIFREAGAEGVEHMATIIMGALRLVAGVAAIFIIKQYPRRAVAFIRHIITNVFLLHGYIKKIMSRNIV
jgi:MFS family permease